MRAIARRFLYNPLIASIPLSSGARLGAYEIVAQIGAGGMGEVWRARDTRLDRSVAIKVLPAEFATNAAVRSRFQREARAISSLSHPNICSLFDVGNEGGLDYLVMELLDGESLADRLARGPLPMADVLRLGTQIADALGAAHRLGVVHRDLKPGNIMLTKAGAKLVDFGLAKSQAAAPVLGASQMTEQKPLTEEGAIVGTFQYMAPEQLEGNPADARTDIFALGAVLYEMTTGKRAFTGKNKTSLIAAIVGGEPRPISELQPVTPQAFERVVRACLEKDPDQRFQSAHDVAMELRWIAAGTASAPGRSRRAAAAWAVAALLAVALAGGAIYHFRNRAVPPALVRFTIPPPAGTNFSRTVAISPDGRDLVFRAGSLASSPQLWLRPLDSLMTKPLPGTENASFAFWAPDGRHVGFFAGTALRRLDTNDGSIRTIADNVAGLAGGGTWNRDGVIVFSPRTEGPLHRMSAEGGEHVPVTTFEKGDTVHVWPWFLPGGEHFLYSVMGVGGANGIYVGSIHSNIRKRVVATGPLPDGSMAVAGNGFIYYLRGKELVSQKFDVDDLEVSGPVTVIDDDIERTGPLRVPLTVSANGTLVYRKAGAVAVDQLSIVDRSGKQIALVGKPNALNRARVSRDGTRVLLSYDDPISSVWSFDLERGTETRMSFENWGSFAEWIDDDAFVYSATVDAPPNVFIKRAQADPIRLTNAPRQHYVTDVTPDGRYALYNTDEPATKIDIHKVALSPPGPPEPVIATSAAESNGRVSPDGRWLAYSSREGGPPQVFITSFPAPGRRWQISTDGGGLPVWSRDGRELVYIDYLNDRLMTVSIAVAGEVLRPGKPQVLIPVSSGIYDVMPDGRFLVATPKLNPASPHLTVIMNR